MLYENGRATGKTQGAQAAGSGGDALTDGEVGGELVLERGEQLVVARVRLEVHLALVRRAGHGHLDELDLVWPAPNRRPPHHPRPAPSTNERTNQSINHAQVPVPPPTRPQESRARAYLLEGGGASWARGERLRARSAGSEVESARLRSGSEPGGRSLSLVSSKSSPEDAAEDSVELRAGSSDMAGARSAWSADWLSGRGWRRAGGGGFSPCR
jgi:hypothetical protein